MNLRLRYILTPMLVGAIAFSCDKKDSEEINPGMSTEATSLATAASLLFEQGFEGSDPLSSFHGIEVGADHSLTIVERPGDKAGKTSRFELRQNDPDVKGSRRAEVTIIKDDTQKEMWYAFQAYFPANAYVDEDNDEVINQWYQSGMGTPSASLRTKAGRIQMWVGNDADNREIIDMGPVVKDQWQQIVVHMVHSYGSDGLTEIWVNGKQIASRKGGNMYDGPLPKWKMGVYKSRWASEKTTTDKRILFYDNIRVGKAGATLADLTAGATTTPPAIEEPTPEDPTTTVPPTEEPATEEPATEEPATEEPATEEPATEEPVTEEPATEEPVTEDPATEEPSTEEPVKEKPSKEKKDTPYNRGQKVKSEVKEKMANKRGFNK